MDRGQQGDIRTQAICLAKFGRVMRRCRMHQIGKGTAGKAAMEAVRAPAARLRGRPGEQQHQPPPPRDDADSREQRAARRRCQRMMAHDHPRSGRQGSQRPPQTVALAFVGHEPEPGQTEWGEGVAARHRPAYSGAMDEHEAAKAAAARLAGVTDRIAAAAKLARRAGEDVALIAISKTQPVESIRPLIAAGQRRFGENRVQEAEAKWPALRDEFPDLELHLVGSLQSNKAEDAVALFDVIHSVDRPSLVKALGLAMDKAGRRPDCFIQVNIGEEEQKGGCAIADLPALLEQARAADLPVIGLMCVPPADLEPAPWFALLAKLARDHGLPGLSMGMSADLEAGVMLGATQVRVGTALFGARA